MNGSSILRVGTCALIASVLLVPLLCVACQRPNPPTHRTQSENTKDPPPPSEQDLPTVPDRFVLQPTIHAERKTYSAGTAFAVRHPDLERPIILTCLHLFGTAGGYPADIPPLELPRVVKKVSLADKFSGAVVGEVAGFIPIPDSSPLNTPSRAGDIAAMWFKESVPVSAGTLAAKSPRIGEPVWLACRLLGREDSSRKLHRVIVTSHEDNLLEYRFEDATLQLRATSGSPILDAKGEVVAIHLGGSPGGGQLVGVGNPASVFLPYLLAACTRNPAAGGP
jgi:hypothetical protein